MKRSFNKIKLLVLGVCTMAVGCVSSPKLNHNHSVNITPKQQAAIAEAVAKRLAKEDGLDYRILLESFDRKKSIALRSAEILQMAAVGIVQGAATFKDFKELARQAHVDIGDLEQIKHAVERAKGSPAGLVAKMGEVISELDKSVAESEQKAEAGR